MASGPITLWWIDGETMETMTDFIFLVSKITADGDCSHEIKRCLLLGRKWKWSCSIMLDSLDPHEAYQASPSMGFSRQGYQNGLPSPSPGDLPDPGIEPSFLHWGQMLYPLRHQGRPWKKSYDKIDSILKSRDITLPAKVHLVKALIYPVVMYGCESWTRNKAEHWRIDAFELWCWRRLLRVPWMARRSN